MDLSQATPDMIAGTFLHLGLHQNAAPMMTFSMLHHKTFSQMILRTSTDSSMCLSTMDFLLMNNMVLLLLNVMACLVGNTIHPSNNIRLSTNKSLAVTT